MTWEPKYIELKNRAEEIKQKYVSAVIEQKRPSRVVVNELSDEYYLSVKSIYRYLKYKGVKYPDRKRDKSGRLLS